jgi:nitrogen regulatory protein PII
MVRHSPGGRSGHEITKEVFMKGITAYIKPHKLTETVTALQKVQGLRGVSVVDIKGFGRRGAKDSPHPVTDDLMDFATYTKLEIFCRDDLLNKIISIINTKAYTGLRGDGKIYVFDVQKALKIGQGEIL